MEKLVPPGDKDLDIRVNNHQYIEIKTNSYFVKQDLEKTQF